MGRGVTTGNGYVDVHSHILPGLDDGPPDIFGSIRMAEEAAQNGVTDIIATPHLNQELFEFSRQARDVQIERLQAALREKKVPVFIHRGAEVRIVPQLPEWYDNGKLPTLAGTRYLLFELPFGEMPFFTHDVTFAIRLKGIIPVLAHPERSVSFQDQPDRLAWMIEAGCLVQVNSTSLTGRLGDPSRATAIELLRRDWVHIIASDGHAAFDRGANFREALAVAAKYVGEEAAERMVKDNPRRILEASTSLQP